MTRRTLLLLALLAAGCGPRTKPAAALPDLQHKRATMGMAAPVVTPIVDHADQANLPDDAPVVGVVVNGQARAYALAALRPFTSHVVNDLIGDVPVSVTYCDLAHCLRVYTREGLGEPIPLAQAGRTEQGLLLRYHNRIYAQVPDSLPGGGGEAVPLPPLAFEETTWGAWRRKHPHTDVYTGSVSPPPPPPNNA